MAKKKMSAAQKARARLQRAVTARPDSAMRSSDPASTNPPVEAVKAYADVLTWADDHPELAAGLMALGEDDFTAMEAGIAYAQRLGFTDEQVQYAAWRIRAWMILGGYQFAYDWATPIAVMTNDEIIAQLRQDAADGKIPFPEGQPQ